MNSIHILTNSPRLTPNGHPRLYPPISSSIRRRNALKKPHHYHPHHNNKPSPDPKLHMVVDLHRLSDRAQILLNRLVSSGADAIDDLRTLVAVDRATQSVVIACRPSTLRFVGGFVLWSLVVVFGFRVLVRLGLRIQREPNREHQILERTKKTTCRHLQLLEQTIFTTRQNGHRIRVL